MRYFKTELSLPATLLAPPRERGYRRTLRYGHARLRPRAVDNAVRDPQSVDTSTVRLAPLPRVQAVVDALIDAVGEASGGAIIGARAACA